MGSIIFGSDARMSVWQRLSAQAPFLLPVDVLLASHHGAQDGVDYTVLQQMKPRWVIVSTQEGRYPDTPDTTALTWYRQTAGESLLRTDQVGTVCVTREGVSTDSDLH